MPTGLQGVTDAIGGVFDSPIIQLGLRAVAIYWVVFWLAASYWAFRDLQLRTYNPVLPYLAAAFIIVFTPVLFPAAIVIYRIVRPHEKIDDVYERTLAQEAMLAEVEAVAICPTCRRRVRDTWLVCPLCRTRLNRLCPGCDRVAGLDWSLCAWCGHELERLVARPSARPAPEPAVPVAARIASVASRLASAPGRIAAQVSPPATARPAAPPATSPAAPPASAPARRITTERLIGADPASRSSLAGSGGSSAPTEIASLIEPASPSSLRRSQQAAREGASSAEDPGSSPRPPVARDPRSAGQRSARSDR